MAWYNDIVDHFTGDDWIDTATNLYNLYDSSQNQSTSAGHIQAGDPWLAANQQAAGQLVDLRSDGGAAYMQTEGAQAQMEAGNTAYYRAQQGGGDRLSTGAAERRETQAISLYGQIVNARDAQLRGVPREHTDTGMNLSSNDRQGSYDAGYNVQAALTSLSGIFGGNTEESYNNTSWVGNMYSGDEGRFDGWYE